MLGFGKNKKPMPQLKTSVGTFIFDGTSWSTESIEGSLIIQSVNPVLDVAAIDRVPDLLKRIAEHREVALDYVHIHGSEFMDGVGDLQLESIDITDLVVNKFGLTFGSDSQPDYTVSVEFENGEPREVWAAD